jgi:putative FmdB family regulatory protein
VPVYVFRCSGCGLEHDVLRRLGDTSAPECPACGGPTHQRLTRVSVKYESFGFSATDSLISDTRNKDYKALRAKADEISDS